MSRHVIVKPLGTRLLLAFALAAVAAVAAAAPAGAISGGTVDSATAPLYPEVVAIGYKPPPDLPPQFQGTALQTCVATLVADTVPTGARLLPPATSRRRASSSTSPSPRTPRPRRRRGRRFPARWSSSQAAGHDQGDPEDLGVVAIPDSIAAGHHPRDAARGRRTRDAAPGRSAGHRRFRMRAPGAERRSRELAVRQLHTPVHHRAVPGAPAVHAGAQRQHGVRRAGRRVLGRLRRPGVQAGRRASGAVLATTHGGNPLCNTVERFYRTDTPRPATFSDRKASRCPRCRW